MGIQNQVANKHESVAVGRQMGLSYVQCAKSSKTLRSIIPTIHVHVELIASVINILNKHK